MRPDHSISLFFLPFDRQASEPKDNMQISHLCVACCYFMKRGALNSSCLSWRGWFIVEIEILRSPIPLGRILVGTLGWVAGISDPRQNGSNRIGIYFSFTYWGRGKYSGAVMVLLPFAISHGPRFLLLSVLFLPDYCPHDWMKQAYQNPNEFPACRIRVERIECKHFPFKWQDLKSQHHFCLHPISHYLLIRPHIAAREVGK